MAQQYPEEGSENGGGSAGGLQDSQPRLAEEDAALEAIGASTDPNQGQLLQTQHPGMEGAGGGSSVVTPAATKRMKIANPGQGHPGYTAAATAYYNENGDQYYPGQPHTNQQDYSSQNYPGAPGGLIDLLGKRPHVLTKQQVPKAVAKKEAFVPDGDTDKWDAIIKEFVLHGLYRECKVTFSDKDILRFNSPVYKRVVVHFARGLEHRGIKVDLRAAENAGKAKKWWTAVGVNKRMHGGRLLQQRLNTKRANILMAIKKAMISESDGVLVYHRQQFSSNPLSHAVRNTTNRLEAHGNQSE